MHQSHLTPASEHTMLSTTARPLIEATVPVLLANGEAITRHFYQRMFTHHPELKNLFNMGNQASGNQAQALAGAVYAYATHMDQPQTMAPALNRIAQKHVSLGITPAQYTIVGRHLLASLGEVLGAAITPDIAEAWDEVYWLMATDLIAREARIYQTLRWEAGQAWPEVRVVQREAASADTVALTLQALPGHSLPDFLAGQYLSVAVPIADTGLTQVRQYSFSDAPGQSLWRITVKREVASADAPAGQVSNHLHDNVQVGDVLRVGLPAGDFHLQGGTRPLVMLSAGVGITPMVSMLRHLAAHSPEQAVIFAHACADREHMPHRSEVQACVQAMPQARLHLWLETCEQLDEGQARGGRMDLSQIDALPSDADVFLCGPLPFMQAQRRWLLANGVPRDRIHHEVFGPDLFAELH